MDKILLILASLMFIISIIAGCAAVSDTKKEIANDLSAQIKNIGKIDSSIFEDNSKFLDTSKKINTFIRIMNEKIETKLPELDTSSSDFEKIKGILKYSPLIGSYNELYESAYLLPSENDSDYTNFYIDLTRFSLDFAMLESQLSYRISYRATGEIATQFGLEKLAPYIGYKAYGAILSGIHWTFRGVIDNETGDLFNAIQNQAKNFSI